MHFLQSGEVACCLRWASLGDSQWSVQVAEAAR